MIPESERLFDQMQAEGFVPTAAIFNALIGVKGRAGHLSDALALLQDMRDKGVKPDIITYSSLLRTCAS
jgi:pentatricopeptide repeat protein